MSDRCDECKFFARLPGTMPADWLAVPKARIGENHKLPRQAEVANYGQCRAGAPFLSEQAVKISGKLATLRITEFPDVHESDWCGQFIPIAEPALFVTGMTVGDSVSISSPHGTEFGDPNATMRDE